jgi:hypothetical protein
MKKISGFIFLLFLSGFVIIYGQDDALTAIRGHYKTLSVLNPKPTSVHESIDTLRFPFDQFLFR